MGTRDEKFSHSAVHGSRRDSLPCAEGFITEWRYVSFSEVDQLFLSAGWDGVDQTVEGTDAVAMAGPAQNQAGDFP